MAGALSPRDVTTLPPPLPHDVGARPRSTPVDVSVVIVSWNVAPLLRECLRSLELYKGSLSLQVVVVDNRSSDDSVEMVRREYPRVRLIVNRENVGFARGNNQGFAVATGRYVFILNPDTLLVDGSLERMVEYLDRHPRVGMVGPRLCYPSGEVQFPCARRFPSLLNFLTQDILNLAPVPWIGPRVRSLLYPYSYDETQPVDAICGAAMLVRCEVLNRIHGFSDAYFFGGEDLELSWQVARAGGVVVYLHDAKVVHFGGQSRSKVPNSIVVDAMMSYAKYYARCRGFLAGIALRSMILTLWVPSRLAFTFALLVSGKVPPQQCLERLKIIRSVTFWRTMRS
jgi:GT2 family glycosyltransferase